MPAPLEFGTDVPAHTFAYGQRPDRFERCGPIGIRIERVLVVRRGEARRGDGRFGKHVELDKVQKQIQRCLVLQISTRDADRQNRLAVL